MNDMSWDEAQANAVADLNREPYGTDVAERVWQRLVEQGGVYRKHRDYCGLGLSYEPAGDVVSFVVVYDAEPIGTLIEFHGRAAFVAYLARQSDYSLAGTEDGPPELRADEPRYVNNQRLDRAFLLGAAA